MACNDSVSMTCGSLRLDLSPSIGGSISRFAYDDGARRAPILRECNSPLENVLDASSFPLVPFVNRIRNGRFCFRGRDVVLAPNMAGDPSPLHGQGWLRPWKVETADATSAVLSLIHEPGEWPWRYEARQYFALDERGLTLDLRCRNLSAHAMPCGLGQHPYFHCSAGTRINTSVDHVWTIDDDVLPVEKVAAEGRFDLRDRAVCGQDLDHGFSGWGASALLTDSDWPFTLRLSSPAARFFQLYSPANGGIFVAEPVSHANAALNAPEEQWAELGMSVLDPGEEMSLEMRIEVTPPRRRLNQIRRASIAQRSAASGDVGEWLKPAVC